MDIKFDRDPKMGPPTKAHAAITSVFTNKKIPARNNSIVDAIDYTSPELSLFEITKWLITRNIKKINGIPVNIQLM